MENGRSGPKIEAAAVVQWTDPSWARLALDQWSGLMAQLWTIMDRLKRQTKLQLREQAIYVQPQKGGKLNRLHTSWRQ